MTVSVAERIKLFKTVRDIEYRVDLLDRTQDTSCRTKAAELCRLFRQAGLLEVYQICCCFRWADQPMPPEMTADHFSDSQHVYVRVRIPETGALVDVDPTWDIGLAQAGFPVAQWDGLNPTVLAVNPFGNPFSSEESQRILDAVDAVPPKAWKIVHREWGGFYDNLNRWIASQRRKPEELHA